MTPKTLEQMAEEYVMKDICLFGSPDEEIAAESFLAGAKAALSLPEVQEMVDALEESEYSDRGSKALAAFDRLLEGVAK